MSEGALVQTMQRIMSILDDIDERKGDIREIYAEAKSDGFDKAAIGAAIREIRGRAKAETPAAEERAAIVELYVSAFDNAPRTCVHVPARKAAYPERVSRPAKIAAPDLSTAAQSEGAAGSIPDQEARAGAAGNGDTIVAAQGAPFAMPSGAGEGNVTPDDTAPAADVPRFALPAARPMRPNCLKPEACAGYGANHCFTCTQAANSTRQPAYEEA